MQATTEAMNSIQNDTTKQESTAGEVKEAMETVAAVTEENSASAEEMAASSEELSAQAQRLQVLVDRFTLGNDRIDDELDEHGDHGDEMVERVDSPNECGLSDQFLTEELVAARVVGGGRLAAGSVVPRVIIRYVVARGARGCRLYTSIIRCCLFCR